MTRHTKCDGCRTPSTCKQLKICPIRVATPDEDEYLTDPPGFEEACIRPEAKETNPKDMAGAPKVSTSLVPELAIIELAQAFRDGARKYGPYNWREAPVRATVYIDAMERHLMLYRGGQDNASDSRLSHLTHIMSGCAILLDAALNGTLSDDRYKLKDPAVLEDMLTHYAGVNARKP